MWGGGGLVMWDGMVVCFGIVGWGGGVVCDGGVV